MISELIDEPKGLYLHKQIKHKNQFENYKTGSEQALVLLRQWGLEPEQAELLQYAKGSTAKLGLIFSQEFKAYCQNLEKTRFLPFNFL